jgi:hypothetical protein
MSVIEDLFTGGKQKLSNGLETFSSKNSAIIAEFFMMHELYYSKRHTAGINDLMYGAHRENKSGIR